MAKFKSVLKKVELKAAGKKRKCYHNKDHTINKGEAVLEVTDGMFKISGYCLECALKMIEKTNDKMRELEAELRRKSIVN